MKTTISALVALATLALPAFAQNYTGQRIGQFEFWSEEDGE